MIHILIVEDDDFAREKVVNFVENLTGLKTMDTTSGNKAVEILKSRKFSLIISDFNMPDGNGDGVLNYLQENKLFIPFIFHTAAISVKLPEQLSIEVRTVEKYDFEDLERSILELLLISPRRK